VFTVVELLTFLVWTWNVVFVAPAGIVTELGALNSQVLLDPALIVRLVVAALVSKTVQVADEFE
jgi:hypothetical protein